MRLKYAMSPIKWLSVGKWNWGNPNHMSVILQPSSMAHRHFIRRLLAIRLSHYSTRKYPKGKFEIRFKQGKILDHFVVTISQQV